MYRKLAVYLYGEQVGILSQNDEGFSFSYLQDYRGVPISLSFPVGVGAFHSKTLFPYFASLAPEGWLKAKVAQYQRIDENDLLGMLLQNGENLIGAVKLRAVET